MEQTDFYKGNYQEIRQYLEEVDWGVTSDMNTEESWKHFIDHIHHCIETLIPKKKTKMDGLLLSEKKLRKNTTHGNVFRTLIVTAIMKNTVNKEIEPQMLRKNTIRE